MEPKTYEFKTQPYVLQVVDVSTAHISFKDSETLDQGIQDPECPIIILDYLEGYFVHLSKEAFIDKALNSYGFSKEFIYLYTESAKKGFYFLRLDADGIEYTDLPTFEW